MPHAETKPPNRMVYCTYCGNGFSRDEHLERHILTHTNVKPFRCNYCHMSFARRDLLQRHFTVHGQGDKNEDGTTNLAFPKASGRTPIACTNCAKTKTKCDKKFPCSRCAQRKLECTSRPSRRQTKQTARQAAAIADMSGSVEGDNGSGQSTSDSNAVTPAEDGLSDHSQTSPLGTLHLQHTEPRRRTSQSLSGSPNVEEKPIFPPGTTSLSMIQPQPTMGPVITPLPYDQHHTHSPMSELDDYGLHSSGFGMDNWSVDGADFQPLARMLEGSTMMHMSADLGNLGLPGEAFFDMNGLVGPVPPTPNMMKMDDNFSDLNMGSSASILYQHSRHNSVAEAVTTELKCITDAQDGWTAFRCNPTIPPTHCPRTARQNLERLEESLKNQEGWENWLQQWDRLNFAQGSLMVAPILEPTRDRLLAITQAFLHKALDIHKEDSCGSPGSGESPNSTGSNFLVFPPARALDLFLRSYANTFECYFPVSARGLIEPNWLIRHHNDRAASLLILMMIAQGAMAIPGIESRWLIGGLTEACRISIFDLIEKNVSLAGDPIVLHAALIFTVQAAWSGDKWQMDIAMGQRLMYLSMLRHSGALEQRSSAHMQMSGNATPEGVWKSWVDEESRNRLVYAWVLADQDLALFRDMAPQFSVTELECPMPDGDSLWHAKDATEWLRQYTSSSTDAGVKFSLKEIFKLFLNDDIVTQNIELTPMHLRLLLHPLQSQVHQYRDLMSCFSDNHNSRRPSRALTNASAGMRLNEAQALLERWYSLAQRYLNSNGPCAMMEANLVMYHLISLNAATNFPEIEKYAREGRFADHPPYPTWIQSTCIPHANDAIVHAGQVLRLVKSMSPVVRPPWWPAAIYRASLVLWLESVAQKSLAANQPNGFATEMARFCVDGLPLDHSVVNQYHSRGVGTPCLTAKDGTLVQIDNEINVLNVCIDLIHEGIATRFSDGIRAKLGRLVMR